MLNLKLYELYEYISILYINEYMYICYLQKIF